MTPPSWHRAQTPRWGAVHIHTDYSDGGIDLPRVIAAAQEAELDFILITDHNTLDAREHHGYHDDLLVMVDVEITPSEYRNHLLALDLQTYPELHRLDPDRYLDEVAGQGGFAWVPHPRGFFNPWCAVYNAPWRLWDKRIAGLELSTFVVEWVEGIRPWNVIRKLRDPHQGVGAPHPATLALWDRLNLIRPVSGFVGLDAHYREALGGRIRTPSYEMLFRTHNVVAWTGPPTGDAETDRKEIHAALRKGRFANVLGHVDERGEVQFEGADLDLHLVAPERHGTTLHLLRDGIPVSVTQGTTASFTNLEPGVYRAEVKRHGRLWALTNPLPVPAVPECRLIAPAARDAGSLTVSS